MAKKRKRAASQSRSRASKKRIRKAPSAAKSRASKTAFDWTDEEVEKALFRQDVQNQAALEQLFGEALLGELQGLVRRSERISVRGGPKALILPGIMGSKLGIKRKWIDDTIWVDPIDIVRGNLLQLVPGDYKIEPLGVILSAYLKMKLTLRIKGIRASFHPYDWRLDVREAGNQLADQIQSEFKDSEVSLIAHSMGGLVARRALKVLNEKSQGHLVKRVIMLGTPHSGSIAPVLVMRRCHDLVQKLAGIDRKHGLDELTDKLFSQLTGLAQLLPQPRGTGGLDLLNPDTWPPNGAPHSDVLGAARDLAADLESHDPKMSIIAGANRTTYVSARIESDEFVFARSRAGDGTVPLDCALLPGIKTYYTQAEHGSMQAEGNLIAAAADIVFTGESSDLPTTPPPFDPSIKEVRESDLRRREAIAQHTPSDSEIRDLLRGFVNSHASMPLAGMPPMMDGANWQSLSEEKVEISRRRQRSIDLCVARGDITQVDARAIVLGVFDGVEPAGAASAIDAYVDGAIRDLVENDLLRGDKGQVFFLPTNRQSLRADFVMFIGLGSPDKFNDEILRAVSRNAALALARAKIDDFATVLLGGGSGHSAGFSLASMVGGFLDALQASDQAEYVRRVTIVERDAVRFASAVSHLRIMATSPIFDETRVTLSTIEIPQTLRPPISSRKHVSLPEPIYLTVRQETEILPKKGNAKPKTRHILNVTLLTADRNATVLVDDREFDERTLTKHLKAVEGSDSDAELKQLGQWIADEVLPRRIAEGIRAYPDRHLIVVHDAPSSRIPWEALDLSQESEHRPALGAGLSRKLISEDLPSAQWLATRPQGERLKVLLVINPTGDLPGAKKEGKIVKEALSAQSGIDVHTLKEGEATRVRIRHELSSGTYDVFHYAGHAFFDPEDRSQSGLQCADGATFTGAQLIGIADLPSLAIINACESGRVRRSSKSKLATNVVAMRAKTSLAEVFLRGGIASYVGTYWPVGDTAASTFASKFYESLLSGHPIAESLIVARLAIYQSSIDWADYIHYGTRTLRLREQALTP